MKKQILVELDHIIFMGYPVLHTMVCNAFKDPDWLYAEMEKNEDIAVWNRARWAVHHSIENQYNKK